MTNKAPLVPTVERIKQLLREAEPGSRELMKRLERVNPPRNHLLDPK